MQRKKLTFRSFKVGSGKKHHGFTLVELMVVLAIVAILAAVGVVAAIGYINKSKFDKNEQNAITLYQTSQTALAKMTANGTIYSWLKDIPGLDIENDSDLSLPPEAETNYSMHKMIALTYNPNSKENLEDKYLNDLLATYFNGSFFSGSMSVVLDICKTKNNGAYDYTVNVLSAFYSAENDSSSGWDQKCKGTAGEDLTEIEAWYFANGLPNSNTYYRSHTSLVGYCDGKIASSVSSVSLPWDQEYEIDGHVIGPTIDKSRAKGYLFNLRNGETLDISWAIFDADRDEKRDEEEHEQYDYYYSAREYHDENLFIVLVDKDDVNNKIALFVDQTELSNAIDTLSTETWTTKEFIGSTQIQKESRYGYITVKVRRPGNSADTQLVLPFTQTYVLGDTRTGVPTYNVQDIDHPERVAGYYEYSISIDAMMHRGIESVSSASNGLGIERLFTDKKPRNIYAVLVGNDSEILASPESPITDASLKEEFNTAGKTTWQTTWKYKSGTSAAAEPVSKDQLLGTYAARAIDDPVYFGNFNNGFCYYYVSQNIAMFDEADDEELYEDYVITGRAVVNTYFGDKVYGRTENNIGEDEYIGGTVWGTSNKEAVLTSCRHLYNIRWATTSDPVCYKVVSDLNWYIHSGNEYYSEAKVFSKTPAGIPSFCSPVDNTGSLCIVSFPALNTLKANQTLTSQPAPGSDNYSINNIQLRGRSFIASSDDAYGLICINKGTIYNLYINNLSLVLENVADGDTCDYIGTDTGIAKSDPVSIEKGANFSTVKTDVPAGCLVGINYGNIGSPDSQLDESDNTVCVTDSIVIGGEYWKYSEYVRDVGGVVGKITKGNNMPKASTNGLIKVSGSFVVVGYVNAGGIIGYTDADLSARLEVNGYSSRYSEFELPEIQAIGTTPSCAVIGNCRAGGAIGKFSYEGVNPVPSFTKPITPCDYSAPDQTTGEFDFDSADDYHISVSLPKDSVVLNVGIYSPNDKDRKDRAVGGAIGYLCLSSADYLGISVINEGNIISTSPSGDGVYCGGAIGKEYKTKISTIYLNCENKEGSVIGSIGTGTSQGAVCAGGALGWFEPNADNHDRRINVSNNGIIRSIGTGNGNGAGGAIGGVSKPADINFVIRAINKSSSEIYGLGINDSNLNGTGGAVGGLNHSDASKWTSNTRIFVENEGLIEGQYNVGGCVGVSPRNEGKIYALNNDCMIIANYDFVGGAVGKGYKDNAGVIQSTLDGASITGRDFVGGAAGRVYLRNYSTVKTYVKGSSTINCNGSIVGGICGDLAINESVAASKIILAGHNSAPVLSINVTGSGTAAGGAVGLLRAKIVNDATVITPDQKDLNRLILRISGNDDVGGAIGRLQSSGENWESNSSSSVMATSNNENSKRNFDVDVVVILHPQSYIYGEGNNVGGAIGNVVSKGGRFTGRIDVSTIYGNTEDASYIKGNSNVGGAVGGFGQTLPYYSNSSSGITVDFTNSPWTVGTIDSSSSTDSNVGGAIGYIHTFDAKNTNSNSFIIKTRLGTSTVNGSGNNVGGAVGYNNNSLVTSSLDVQLDVGGTINGASNVGGAVGYNYCNQSNGAINEVTTRINGYVSATGDNVGGAIGNNLASINIVQTTINGYVYSPDGNNVGGAIGYSNASSKSYLIKNVTATIQGSGQVHGKDNVGGTVGFNYCNTEDMISYITGEAKVIGINCVGGVLGYASAEQNANGGIFGSHVLNGSNYGRVLRITANISADRALSGTTRMGGAVGQIGYKNPKNNKDFRSPALVSVKAVINSAYLFDPNSTGLDSTVEDVCIGGVIGIFVDGRLGVSGGGQTGMVELTGSGGVVDLGNYVKDFGEEEVIHYFPNRTYGNAVLIAANGCSVGGVIGEIGIPEAQQNLYVANIGAKDTLNICVVSLNGANRIGGWIGSSYAAHGGIGAETQAEFDKAPVIYNVNNVKAVISVNQDTGVGGSAVGGFCGCIDFHNGNQYDEKKFGVYAQIYVNLSDATIIGGSKVGGAFGEATYARFKGGGIYVTLRSHTNVGDIKGNALPGDLTDYTAVCYEAGGVIGHIEKTRNKTNSSYYTFHVPVEIVIDSTSRISGMKVPDGNASDYGVGGAFGSVLDAAFSGKAEYQWVRVTSETGSAPAVLSSSVNVGGIAGFVKNSDLYNASANVTVQGNGDGISVGGVVGKVINEKNGKTISNCHFGPDSVITADKYFNSEKLFGEGAIYDPASYCVISEGASYTGGFLGSVDGSVAISKCYTTATVSSNSGEATGGFAGVLNSGTVEQSYVGGRTYYAQYDSVKCNISGYGNVGGFVGKTTGNVSLKNCYSTASVQGSAANVGGFVGLRDDASSMNSCYCTGYVKSSEAGSVGSFAGNSKQTNYTSTYAMKGINDVSADPMSLIGTIPLNDIDRSKIDYKSASEINALGGGTAHPFDNTLGSTYELHPVIDSTHWGDWPHAVSNGTNIAALSISLDENLQLVYSLSGYKLQDYLTIMDGEDSLDYNVDYTLQYLNADNVGRATVVISGKGDYYGVVTKTFQIIPLDLSTLTAEDYEIEFKYLNNTPVYGYTGEEVKPETVFKLGEYTLKEGTDYYLQFSPDNKNIGTVTVTVVGWKNFEGVLPTGSSFEIVGSSLANAEVTLTNATEEQLVFDNTEKTPGVIVRLNGKTLKLDEDYSISYVNNLHVGTYVDEEHEGPYVLITAKSQQYSGSYKAYFTITKVTNKINTDPTISNWTWGEKPSQPTPLMAEFGYAQYSVYSDAACENLVLGPCEKTDDKTAEEVVQEAMKVLEAGSYYLLAEVADADDYSGVSKIVPFTVNIADLSKVATTISLSPEYFYYDGEEHKPVVAIEYNGITLKENTVDEPGEYTIEWDSDLVNAGTKTITITGVNNCKGTITAQYEIRSTWEVTFDLQEGYFEDPEIQTTIYVHDGDTVARPSDDPVRDGYRFDGWLWKPNPSTEDIYNFDSSVRSNLRIYAKWVEVFHVKFYLDNNELYQDQTVDINTAATKPQDPDVTGYIFEGWYLDDSHPWTNFDSLIDRDYDLYAKLTPITRTVDFVLSDTETISVTYTYPETVKMPSVPSRDDGYVVIGWYLDEECSEDKEFTDFDQPLMDDVTLYAKWVEGYTVTYVISDNEADNIIKAYASADNVQEPAVPVRDDGFVFDGWYLDTTYSEEKKYSGFGAPLTENVVLYAKWKNPEQG